MRWLDSFQLTGMDVGADRRAWRLTPELPYGASNWSEAGLTVRTDPTTGVLRVGPLGFAANSSAGAVTPNCELLVPWGEVFALPDTVAPLGLWILQSRPPLPLSISCGSVGVFPWPIKTDDAVTSWRYGSAAA